MRNALGTAIVLVTALAAPAGARAQNPETPANQALALRDRGEGHLSAGRLELAVTDFNAALALKPNDVPTLGRRADAYAKLKLFQLAVSDYTAILAVFPRNGFVASLRALNKTMIGRIVEASLDCDAALAAQPNDHGINETCGMVSLKGGDPVKAGARFELAISTGIASDMQPVYGRALARLRIGPDVAAQADRDRVVTADPRTVAYFTLYGLTR